jgi:hypothetical protein
LKKIDLMTDKEIAVSSSVESKPTTPGAALVDVVEVELRGARDEALRDVRHSGLAFL